MASVLHFTVLLFLACALGIGTNVNSAACSCPNGWIRYRSRCFVFHYHAKDWASAERACVSIGGNLASIHNRHQQNFIRNLIFNLTGRHRRVWLGGYDAVREGVWLWSDGSKFHYKHWGRGQPSNYRKREHCLETNYLGNFWNDHQCHVKKSFLCSMNL